MDWTESDPCIEKMCKTALRYWGNDAQMLMAIEEAAELIVSICKFTRGKNTPEQIVDELADNRVMAKQIMHMVGITEPEVASRTSFKWNRLRERLIAASRKRAKARIISVAPDTITQNTTESGKEPQ